MSTNRISNRITGSVTIRATLPLAIFAAAGSALGQNRPAIAPALFPDAARPMCSTPANPESMYSTFAWPSGNVYYRFDPAVTAPQRQKVLDAWAVISAAANVQFIPWTSEGNFITIKEDPTGSSSSHIGMRQPAGSGEQFLNIAPWAWDLPGIIMHETMHALGLWHEHQRSDRDQYITVDPSLLTDGNYRIVTNPFPNNNNNYGPYDLGSLMHYAQAGGGGVITRAINVKEPYRRAWQWRIGEMLQTNPALSNGDRWVLYLLYPGPITPPPRGSELLSPAQGQLVGPAWTPQFSWAPAEAASSYRLQVDDSRAFDAPEIDVVLPAAATSYTHPAALPPNRLHWWRVLASNSSGTSEPYPLQSRTLITAAGISTTLFVDESAPSGGDGSTWNLALRNLSAALEIAHVGNGTVTEIRVGQGVYTPDFASHDRTQSFELPPSCAVRGGYAGFGAPDPDARDSDLYLTVLSGDLNGDDGPAFAGMGDNSLHVVVARSSPATTVLEGFTIRGGNAQRETWWGAMGGGALTDGNPVFRRCTFLSNHADDNGGAVAVFFGSADPRFENCRFEGNRVLRVATDPGAVMGGGAIGEFRANGAFIGCTFINNSAPSGGAVSARASSPQFTNCLFTGNQATALSGNYLGGGAVMGLFGSLAALRNCTLVGNTSVTTGGAVQNNTNAAVSVSNSILWNNQPDQAAGSPSISYSAVQGGAAGTSNTASDPLFEPGTWRPGALSACIDAGDNTSLPPGILTDLANNPRFHDDPGTPNHGVPGGLGGAAVVDMGAYEFQGSSCYANCDRSTALPVLNVNDFSCFLNQFAAGSQYANCDNSTVQPILNVNDFSCFINNYAAGCP